MNGNCSTSSLFCALLAVAGGCHEEPETKMMLGFSPHAAGSGSPTVAVEQARCQLNLGYIETEVIWPGSGVAPTGMVVGVEFQVTDPSGDVLVVHDSDGYTSADRIDGKGEGEPGIKEFVLKGAFHVTETGKYTVDVTGFARVGAATVTNSTSHTFWCDRVDRPVVLSSGDYDGDGVSDRAVYRPDVGEWVLDLSSTGERITESWPYGAGGIPVPGDYDGDGITDLAVYHCGETLCRWRVKGSSDGWMSRTWGWPQDIPVPGDYNGDGYTDFATWRWAYSSIWFVRLNVSDEQYAVNWGWIGDIPVPADYDGDGVTDMAVYRPSSASRWFVLRSSDGLYDVETWGWTDDIPVPMDYDEDGLADYAAWRGTSGRWFIIDSSTGTSRVDQLGVAGDAPVPGVWSSGNAAVYRPDTSSSWLEMTGDPVEMGSAGDMAASGPPVRSPSASLP